MISDFASANLGNIALTPKPPHGIPGQCVNLGSSWSMYNDGPELMGATAYEIFLNFRHPFLEVHYGSAGLQAEDIVFFYPDNVAAGTGYAGHVDVAVEVTTQGFKALDTDWNGSPEVQYEDHGFGGVCGYFRLINNGELSMTPEVKAMLEDLKAHILSLENQVKTQDAKLEDLKQHIINLEKK